MKDGTIRIESTDPKHVEEMAKCKVGDKAACFKVKMAVDSARHEATHTEEGSKYPVSVMHAAMGMQPNGKRATLEGRIASIEKMEQDEGAKDEPTPPAKKKRSVALEAMGY